MAIILEYDESDAYARKVMVDVLSGGMLVHDDRHIWVGRRHN